MKFRKLIAIQKIKIVNKVSTNAPGNGWRYLLPKNFNLFFIKIANRKIKIVLDTKVLYEHPDKGVRNQDFIELEYSGGNKTARALIIQI